MISSLQVMLREDSGEEGGEDGGKDGRGFLCPPHWFPIWQYLCKAAGFVPVVSNVAILCFSSTQLLPIPFKILFLSQLLKCNFLVNNKKKKCVHVERRGIQKAVFLFLQINEHLQIIKPVAKTKTRSAPGTAVQRQVALPWS